MKTLKIVYLISGIIFFLLSICCVTFNLKYVYDTPNMVIYISNAAYVIGTSFIFFTLSLFMFITAFISCSRAEFENHLRRY